MDLWLVLPDPDSSVRRVKRLESLRAEDVRSGRAFLVKSSSPVYIRGLARTIWEMLPELPGMENEQLEKVGLWRRHVQVPGYKAPLPVYEARLHFPPIESTGA